MNPFVQSARRILALEFVRLTGQASMTCLDLMLHVELMPDDGANRH